MTSPLVRTTSPLVRTASPLLNTAIPLLSTTSLIVLLCLMLLYRLHARWKLILIRLNLDAHALAFRPVHATSTKNH